MKRWLAVALTLSLLAPGPIFAQGVRSEIASPISPATLPSIALPASALQVGIPHELPVAPQAGIPHEIPAAPQAALIQAAAIQPLVAAQAQVRTLGKAVAAEGVRADVLNRTFDNLSARSEASAAVAGSVSVARQPLARPTLRKMLAAAVAAAPVAAPVAAHAHLVSVLAAVAGWVVPIAAMVGLSYYLTRRQRRAMENQFDPKPKPVKTGKTNPKDPKAVPEEPKVMFDDVAGQEEAKLELQRVVRFLKNPERYKKINPRVKAFKGILFFGPPGTGKTLLARALANEAEVPFVSRKGSDFVNVYVGKGAANIRAAFEEVRTAAKGGPGILYIDEIDSIGHKRSGADNSHDNGEDDKAITALLAEMDGFEKDNIIVIASTNRPDKLDPALVRGGRFGLKVPVGLPDVEGREQVLKVHAKEMAMDADVNLREVAKQTPGLAGADLEHVVQRASILAGDEGAEKASMKHFLAAVDEMTIGQQRKLIMSAEEKRVVTYHESGHALVSHLLPNADPVRKVTIIPHGLNALGLMQSMPEEDRNIQSRAWLLDRMAVALGGRAAEEMMTGEVYSGAQNDLEQATNIARYMVTKFGMSSIVGPVAYDLQEARALELSEDYKQKVEAEVKKLVSEAQERAKQVLTEHRDVLEAMAQKLREKETLRGDEIEALIPSNKRKDGSGPSGPRQLALKWLAQGFGALAGFSPLMSLVSEHLYRSARAAN